ncbi:MAG: hypothetical protein K2L83_05065 [Muribaculaceae bacterium]|nr:hypothetical protein [Muribaculaceae bacterium]
MQDYTEEERDYIAELIKVRRALHAAILKAWHEYCGYDLEGIEMESEEFTISTDSNEFYSFFDGFRAGWEGRKDCGSFLLSYLRDGIDPREPKAGYERGRRFRERNKCPDLINICALEDCKMEESEEVTFDGWAARDGDGEIYFHPNKPKRYTGYWLNKDGLNDYKLPQETLPSLTWRSAPIEVSITIKPKKQ